VCNGLRRKALNHSAVTFSGRYGSWNEALAHCEGPSPENLQRRRIATQKIRSGEAVFECDSVLFAEPHYPYPLIACALSVSLQKRGNLSVLDFGGGLGTTYYHCKPFLKGIEVLRWSIVERPEVVECGQREFQDEELRFYFDIESALAPRTPDVVILSGVLHYLDKPKELLVKLSKCGIPYAILARVPLVAAAQDILAVQYTSPQIYPQSIPAWFFAQEALVSHLTPNFEILAEFDGTDSASLPGESVAFKGYFLRTR
jgi:putative methyltransferase (TIGR04325 family)